MIPLAPRAATVAGAEVIATTPNGPRLMRRIRTFSFTTIIVDRHNALTEPFRRDSKPIQVWITSSPHN